MGQTLVFKCATSTCSDSTKLDEGIGELWPDVIISIQKNPFDRTRLETFFNKKLASSIGKALDEGYQLYDLSENALFCEECKTLTSETTWVCKKGEEEISSKHKCRKCKSELRKVEVKLNPLENKLDTDFEVVIKMGRNKFHHKCPKCGSERFKFENLIMWD